MLYVLFLKYKVNINNALNDLIHISVKLIEWFLILQIKRKNSINYHWSADVKIKKVVSFINHQDKLKWLININNL